MGWFIPFVDEKFSGVKGSMIKVSKSFSYGWLCGTVVERQSLTGELSLSHARPAVHSIRG